MSAAERNQKTVSSWRLDDAREECIYHQVRSMLHKDAAVYITGNNAFDRQELVELTTLWAVPKSSRGSAQQMISIGPGKACAGESLKVQPVIPQPLLTSMILPNNGANVSGTVVLVATTTDLSTVTKVEFLLTGETQQMTRIEPARLFRYGWFTKWNTTHVAGGTYTLRSIAYDSSRRVSQSLPVTISVDNES